MPRLIIFEKFKKTKIRKKEPHHQQRNQQRKYQSWEYSQNSINKKLREVLLCQKTKRQQKPTGDKKYIDTQVPKSHHGCIFFPQRLIKHKARNNEAVIINNKYGSNQSDEI